MTNQELDVQLADQRKRLSAIQAQLRKAKEEHELGLKRVEELRELLTNAHKSVEASDYDQLLNQESAVMAAINRLQGERISAQSKQHPVGVK